MWNALLFSTVLFVAIISAVSHFLPDFDEVPPGFPVMLMWKFRIAALEIQMLLWGVLGFAFGWLTDRDFASGFQSSRVETQ